MLEYLKQYKLSYFINNDNKADNFYTKEVKVGKYWDSYMIDDRSLIQFGELKFETSIYSTINWKTIYFINFRWRCW